MQLKDFITPIITVLTLAGGMAYSSGLRDEKITNIQSQYTDMKNEVVKLRESVDKLTQSMIRRQIFEDAKLQGR